MLSRFFPLTAGIASRLNARRGELDGLPAEEIAPGETRYQPRVFFDPDDWQRVTAMQAETTADLERARIEGGDRVHGRTLRYRLSDALVTPAGIFQWNRSVFRHGSRPWRAVLSQACSMHRTGFCAGSGVTQEYFGHFINDGLPAAALRRPDEVLVLFGQPSWAHADFYLHSLGLAPLRADLSHFEELFVADDRGMNAHRRARMGAIHQRLQDQLTPSGHAGLFIRRGRSGAARELVNEDAVADAFLARGFAVCSTADPAATILAAAAGVPVVVTMEGSHWVHGHLGAARGALITLINPADRFNNLAADMAPALDQRVATIVAPRCGAGYRVDLRRLLQLVDSSLDAMAASPVAG